MLILKRFVPKAVEFNFQLTSIFRAMSIRNSEQAIQKKTLIFVCETRTRRVWCQIGNQPPPQPFFGMSRNALGRIARHPKKRLRRRLIRKLVGVLLALTDQLSNILPLVKTRSLSSFDSNNEERHRVFLMFYTNR